MPLSECISLLWAMSLELCFFRFSKVQKSIRAHGPKKKDPFTLEIFTCAFSFPSTFHSLSHLKRIVKNADPVRRNIVATKSTNARAK